MEKTTAKTSISHFTGVSLSMPNIRNKAPRDIPRVESGLGIFDSVM